MMDRLPAHRPLILASGSPRRRQLLALGGWTFQLRPADTPEIPHPGESPTHFVQRMSETKAHHAAQGVDGGALVIGADTTVVVDGRLLNKPADAREALSMLTLLRGRTHEVFTAVTLIDTATREALTDVARSRVPMRRYGDDEISAYVAGGDPLDKAGAYAIQHPSFQPVDMTQFGDCFANVMGLPLCHMLRLLRRLGVEAVDEDLPGRCQDFLGYACPVYRDILNSEAA